MIPLVRSELLKIRTTRGWYAYLAVIVLLVGIAVAADIGDSPDDVRGLTEFQVGLVDSAGIAALLAIVLGITMVTTEFRHGTITPTLLAEPRREAVLASKAVAGTIVALFFALLALIVVAVVASIWLSIVEADIHLGNADVATRAAQAILLCVLWGLTGVAIGSVVHSQVAALVGTLRLGLPGRAAHRGSPRRDRLRRCRVVSAVSRARLGGRHKRGGHAFVLARRGRLACVDRAHRCSRDHTHPPPRHQLTRTLRGWPRR